MSDLVGNPEDRFCCVVAHKDKTFPSICRDRELSERQALHEAGLKLRQKLPNRSARLSPKSEVLEEIVICDVSRKICYLSMVNTVKSVNNVHEFSNTQ